MISIFLILALSADGFRINHNNGNHDDKEYFEDDPVMKENHRRDHKNMGIKEFDYVKVFNNMNSLLRERKNVIFGYTYDSDNNYYQIIIGKDFLDIFKDKQFVQDKEYEEKHGQYKNIYIEEPEDMMSYDVL